MSISVLAVTGRMSLAGVGHDWDDECFVVYRQCNILELREFRAINKTGMTDDQAIDLIIDTNKKYFVKGQIKTLDQQGDSVITPMTADMVQSLPEAVQYSLFASISGASIDPKDTPPAQVPVEPQPTAEVSTETSSSETQTTL